MTLNHVCPCLQFRPLRNWSTLCSICGLSSTQAAYVRGFNNEIRSASAGVDNGAVIGTSASVGFCVGAGADTGTGVNSGYVAGAGTGFGVGVDENRC